MKTLIHALVITLLISSHASAADSQDALVSRMYYLRSGALQHVTALVRGEKGKSPWELDVTPSEWKQFFTHWKATWPEGSEISYHSEIQRLVVKNTTANLDRIEAIMSLGPDTMAWSQLEIEARFISFDKSDILPEIKAGPLTAKVILEIQNRAASELLAAPVVRTPSGQQATIKSVTECLYPTDFEVTPITSGGTNTNDVAMIIGAIVQPGGFQTREVGVLMEVLPEVATQGQLIHLTLTPQIVFPPEWKDYGSKYSSSTNASGVLPMQQPFFPVVTVTSSLTVPNNTFVLLGGGTPSPDGKKIIYILVRARIVDLEGNTIGDKMSNKPLQNTSQ